MNEDLKWAAPDRYDLLKEFAKENRMSPTMAEHLLWQHLRGKSLGTKFFRQYIIADYIADFASIQHHLIIEVDGAYHSESEQIAYDENRTQRLQHLGFKVIRFSNEEILHDIDTVIKTIKQNITYELR